VDPTVASDTVRVGITDYAQNHLGDVIVVDLPRRRKHGHRRQRVRRGRVDQVDVRPHRSGRGEVVTVNTDLEDRPELVNSYPYGARWMLELRLVVGPAGEPTVSLLDASGYEATIS
jgi:glycine cleavage system H protein